MVSQTTLRSISFRKRTILTHTQSLPECRSTSCCTCRARAQTAYFFTCSVQSSPHRGSRRMGARRRWSAATTQVVPEREEAPPAPRHHRPPPSAQLGARSPEGSRRRSSRRSRSVRGPEPGVGERTGMGRGEERGGAQGRPLLSRGGGRAPSTPAPAKVSPAEETRPLQRARGSPTPRSAPAPPRGRPSAAPGARPPAPTSSPAGPGDPEAEAASAPGPPEQRRPTQGDGGPGGPGASGPAGAHPQRGLHRGRTGTAGAAGSAGWVPRWRGTLLCPETGVGVGSGVSVRGQE